MPSIDGLGSGLDTTTIINQLMQVERLPQQRLSTRRLTALSQGTAWTGIAGQLSSLVTTARGLSTANALARTAATSSSTAVGITATATAAPGSHTLTVRSLATAHVLGSATLPSSSTAVGAGALVLSRGLSAIGATAAGTTATAGAATGTYALEVTAVGGGRASITVNGTSYDVDASGSSVEVAGLRLDTAGLTTGRAEVTVARTTGATATVADLAAQLNSARGVASAAAVDLTPGSTRLLLSDTRTGVANALQVSTEGLGALGGFTDVRPPADAQLELDGLAVTRGENTVTDLLPGVTLALQAPVTDAALTVTPDDAASTTAATSLVTSLNTVLGGIRTATSYDAATKKGAPLAGESGARSLTDALRSVMSTTTGPGGTLAGIGVNLQLDGTYAVDATAFSAALARDPKAVTDLVASVATALTKVATDATDVAGVVTRGQEGANTTARDLQDQVDRYEVRLGLTQARLTKQFTALDTLLGTMKSQGNALAGQLGSLPSR